MSDAPKTLAECSQRANAALDILKAADLTPEQRMAVYDLVNAYLFASDGCTKLHRVATELIQSVRSPASASCSTNPVPPSQAVTETTTGDKQCQPHHLTLGDKPMSAAERTRRSRDKRKGLQGG